MTACGETWATPTSVRPERPRERKIEGYAGRQLACNALTMCMDVTIALDGADTATAHADGRAPRAPRSCAPGPPASVLGRSPWDRAQLRLRALGSVRGSGDARPGAAMGARSARVARVSFARDEGEEHKNANTQIGAQLVHVGGGLISPPRAIRMERDRALARPEEKRLASTSW